MFYNVKLGNNLKTNKSLGLLESKCVGVIHVEAVVFGKSGVMKQRCFKVMECLQQQFSLVHGRDISQGI